MNYKSNMATESHGIQVLLEYLRIKTGNAPINLTDESQQKLVGDLIVVRQNKATSVELKIEERFTGRMFVETWANREWGTVGWLHTCKSQLLLCYYIDADVLIGVSMQALRQLLLSQTNGTYDSYKQLKVKSSQPNDTWGIAIPIEHLRAANLQGWFEAKPKETITNVAA